MTTTLIDISRPITPETAVWPGDTPFNLETQMDMRKGASCNLTTLTISAHMGSHADAPYHFDMHGQPIDQVDLFPYWGTAQVVTVNKASGPLLPADFAAYDLTLAPRLLVRTPAEALPYSIFPEDIVFPSPELADFLGTQSIILYGTDAPSMDAIDSLPLPGHHAMLRNKIAVLESLDLSRATDGLYELVALPLKIVGGDGSPVRAVLRATT